MANHLMVFMHLVWATDGRRPLLHATLEASPSARRPVPFLPSGGGPCSSPQRGEVGRGAAVASALAARQSRPQLPWIRRPM